MTLCSSMRDYHSVSAVHSRLILVAPFHFRERRTVGRRSIHSPKSKNRKVATEVVVRGEQRALEDYPAVKLSCGRSRSPSTSTDHFRTLIGRFKSGGLSAVFVEIHTIWSICSYSTDDDNLAPRRCGRPI